MSNSFSVDINRIHFSYSIKRYNVSALYNLKKKIKKINLKKILLDSFFFLRITNESNTYAHEQTVCKSIEFLHKIVPLI